MPGHAQVQASRRNAKGQLAKMDDDPGAEHSCFDIRGRQEEWRRTISGVDYDVAWSYDAAGRLADLTYPVTVRVPVVKVQLLPRWTLSMYWKALSLRMATVLPATV